MRSKGLLVTVVIFNVLVLIAGIAFVVVELGEDDPSPEPAAARPAPQDETEYTAATATVPSVATYADASAGEPTGQLDNPTFEGFPLTFSVMERQGDRLQVRIPERPNGATAWVAASDVRTNPVPNKIVIEVEARKLKVMDGDEAVLEEPVAVGTAKTPTPLGNFYVDISLANPGSPYGAHILSVAGFSDVLTNFGGGRGQIAIHGWGDPSVLGKAVSNGCIRMTNDTITKVAEVAPVGTPVEIVA